MSKNSEDKYFEMMPAIPEMCQACPAQKILRGRMASIAPFLAESEDAINGILDGDSDSYVSFQEELRQLAGKKCAEIIATGLACEILKEKKDFKNLFDDMADLSKKLGETCDGQPDLTPLIKRSFRPDTIIALCSSRLADSEQANRLGVAAKADFYQKAPRQE